MTRNLLLVFSNPVEGREDEYNEWYAMTRDTPDAPYRYLAL
jgi:hypothetical protein